MASAPPLTDPAGPILAGDPALNDDQRADLWDIFHTSKDPQQLASHLQLMAVPEDTKQKLFQAKSQSTPVLSPVDKTTQAINKIAEIDPKVLELAESHPKVTAALVSAAQAAEKASGSAQEPRSGKSQGKPQAEGAKRAPLAQSPRVDGLEHFPPIPDGHYRVLASDGGVHDVPVENIEKAREIDPRLHVLNP